MNWHELEQAVEHATQNAFKVNNEQAIGGGCINSACRLDGDDRSYFVKLNALGKLPMFEAELEGLRELAATGPVRIPAAIVTGTLQGQAFIVLEYVAMGRGGRETDRILGRQLAELHGVRQPYFGWHRDNTIGSTPQLNDAHDNWLVFLKSQRFEPQFKLAQKNGFGGRLQTLGERLLADLEKFFKGYDPAAALLHGDLWGGNASVDTEGQPVIFDPACYYGDREADLAMTELFGGFSADFYSAYQEVYPLDSGYAVRKDLYNLYHIMNHANLFGSGYASQAERMIQGLLGEVD